MAKDIETWEESLNAEFRQHGVILHDHNWHKERERAELRKEVENLRAQLTKEQRVVDVGVIALDATPFRKRIEELEAQLACQRQGEPVAEVVDNANGKWAALLPGADVKAGDKLYTAKAVPRDEVRAVRDVIAERERQKSVEGWTPEHDDEHDDESLSLAAACYAIPDIHLLFEKRPETFDDSGGRGDCPVWRTKEFRVPKLWPKSWVPAWWKPKGRRKNLVRAAALLLAEIERFDRATNTGKEQK